MSVPLINSIVDNDKPSTVHAAMYFLTKDDLFVTEKPYAFRFPFESEHIPQTNMQMKREESIQINDMRGKELSFSIEKTGFEILSHASKLPYEDFYNPEKVSVYLRELESVLQNHLKASHVEVFRHGVSVVLCSRRSGTCK